MRLGVDPVQSALVSMQRCAARDRELGHAGNCGCAAGVHSHHSHHSSPVACGSPADLHLHSQPFEKSGCKLASLHIRYPVPCWHLRRQATLSASSRGISSAIVAALYLVAEEVDDGGGQPRHKAGGGGAGAAVVHATGAPWEQPVVRRRAQQQHLVGHLAPLPKPPPAAATECAR